MRLTYKIFRFPNRPLLEARLENLKHPTLSLFN